MNKILFALIFCVNSLFASVPVFEHNKIFNLKKDEKAYVYLREKGEEKWDIFEFSWTLYDGLNLVVHSKFRKYPRQIMLSLRHGLKFYKQTILPPLAKPYGDDVWLYLEFNKFEKAKARFAVYISDKAQRIEVKFEPEKEE